MFVGIRFNQKEQVILNNLKRNYPYLNTSALIKKLLFRDIKPFLHQHELTHLALLTKEIRAIGVNLNQMIKFNSSKHLLHTTKSIHELILILTNLIKGFNT